MDVIMADGDTNRVSSLPQSGFAFPLTEPLVNISVAPHAGMAVIEKANGEVALSVAQYLNGWNNATINDPLAQAAVVSLAREYVLLVSTNDAVDDVLAMMPSDLDRGLRRKFIGTVFSLLKRPIDHSMDDLSNPKARMLAWSNNALYRVLGAQFVLGYKDNPSQKDIPGKFAWALLNTKSICSSIMSSVQQKDVPPQLLANWLASLRSPIRWLIDLLVSVIDDLFTLSQECQGMSMNRESLQEQVEQLNSPSLHLILHSASRSLLRCTLDWLRLYHTRASQILNHASQPCTISQSTSISDATTAITSLPFALQAFEGLCKETDDQVRSTYMKTGWSEPVSAPRADVEKAMLVEAEVPQLLVPVVTNMLQESVPKMRDVESTDVARIYFWDTRWLGLKDDAGAKALVKAQRVDVLRKTELAPGVKGDSAVVAGGAEVVRLL
ncbi:Mediator of RNA polymerase II transcription subunit 16 [Taxawa tesnikishii (nom. ined.)]|nr:Mediator of RNA polymerase II transcription subunit 16 [Dothideales sp. JES 119]